MSEVRDLASSEYIGDSITVGWDDRSRITLVKEYSDGRSISISLDGEVIENFLEYIFREGKSRNVNSLLSERKG